MRRAAQYDGRAGGRGELRIDAHQHFWRYDAREYGWMDERMGSLRRDFLPQHLTPVRAGVGFEGSVAVQARSSEGETRWLLELADGDARIVGVVGWVDLCAPAVDAALARFAAHPRCVGMRHLVHDEPDVEFMLRPDFLRGLGRLAAHGLAYDLLLRPGHLPVAAEVVALHPEQRFVLDHIAKPRIAEREVAPWADDLRRLARFGNVTCKLSGLVTEADWRRWKPSDLTPYLDVALEAFGPERCMIGSDWPVCTLAGGYADVMAVVVDHVAGLTPDEREQVLGGTCARVYRIP